MQENIRLFTMEIMKLHGTNKRLYELVCSLVMNPVILRQNNNYPFKTDAKYVWYVATEGEQTIGFIPIKMIDNYNYLIDNYYVKGDDTSLLKSLLKEIIKDQTNETELWATVHKRHVELFIQNGFCTHLQWKNYDKMKYCSKKNVVCTD